jgi:hypothetical protein
VGYATTTLAESRGYWLYDWIATNRINGVDDAQDLLASKRGLSTLRDVAAPHTPQLRLPIRGVVAGHGLDLSGELDCFGRECQVRQVDELFTRVLLYFDNILVAGLAPDFGSIPDRRRRSLRSHESEILLDHVGILLDLRRRGLDELLGFAQKPSIGYDFLDEAAKLGMVDLTNQVEELVARLTREAEVHIELHDDHGHYSLTHPSLEHTMWGHAHPTASSQLPTAVDAARDVASRYAAALVSDVRAAVDRGLPLSCRFLIHEVWRDSRHSVQSDVGSVVLRLHLPVLRSLSADSMLRMRTDHADAFERFRAALVAAVGQRISSRDTPEEVARQVDDEVLAPALADIRARLNVAEATLARKVVLAGGLGLLTATVGLLVSAPLLAPIAGAAALTAVPAAQKYLDTKGEVELSDMYFLWETARQHKGHP